MKEKIFTKNSYDAYANEVRVDESYTEIDSNAFAHNRYVEYVYVGKNVKKIGKWAFADCKCLKDVIFLTKSLKSIDNRVFEGSLLDHLNIPEGVETIGLHAFAYSKIKSICLPKSVTLIQSYAFSHCSQLETIIMPHNNKLKCEESVFDRCTSLGYLDMTSIDHIPPHFCEKCTKLSFVSTSNNLLTIGESAFEGCTALTSFDSKDNLRTIGTYAFSDCRNLKVVTIPSTTKAIYDYAFNYCTSLNHVTLPDGLLTLERAFVNCCSLERISIPKNIRVIKSWTFAHCTSLKHVDLCDVEKIDGSAFLYCGFEHIDLPQSLTAIEESAFSKSQLKEVTLPPSVTTINHRVFLDTPLKKVVAPSVHEVKGLAFAYCRYLKDVVLADKATIHPYAYANSAMMWKTNKE